MVRVHKVLHKQEPPYKQVPERKQELAYKPVLVRKLGPVHKLGHKASGSSFVAAGKVAGNNFLVHKVEGMGVRKARDMLNDMTMLFCHIYRRCLRQLLLVSPESTSIELEKSNVA